jgi:hypothetical protein
MTFSRVLWRRICASGGQRDAPYQGGWRAGNVAALTTRGGVGSRCDGRMTTPQNSALDHFLHILTLPDNIPIVGLMVLLFFFTWLGLREARKNDQLLEQDREDDILERMQD